MINFRRKILTKYGTYLIRHLFKSATNIKCTFCGKNLYENPFIDYYLCSNDFILLSKFPPPNYEENTIYVPDNDFILKNIEHYEKFLSTFPELQHFFFNTKFDEIIDLAGGLGLFPRIILANKKSKSKLSVIDIGKYANIIERYLKSNRKLHFIGEEYFIQQNVFRYLKENNLLKDNIVITSIHFIDHLTEPYTFLEYLKKFINRKKCYFFLYCHALESFKGKDWFVLNTHIKGEHQIIYSHSFLKKLMSKYFNKILYCDIYNDDQFFIIEA